MINEKHLERLLRLYVDAPSSFYQPEDISVSAGQARVRFETEEEDLDAAGSVDRAMYFKVLCDASALAAGSLVEDQFVVNETFDLYTVRAVSAGSIIAHARVVSARDTVFTVEAVLTDEQGRKLASAHGVFTKSPMRLPDESAGQGAAEGQDPSNDTVSMVAYGSLWESPFGIVFLN